MYAFATFVVTVWWPQGARNDVIFTIDVADVLSGPDVNGTTMAPRSRCDEGDFEDWTVSKENAKDMCVLGQKHTFHRVGPSRREASCLLPKDYKLADTSTTVLPPAIVP